MMNVVRSLWASVQDRPSQEAAERAEHPLEAKVVERLVTDATIEAAGA